MFDGYFFVGHESDPRTCAASPLRRRVPPADQLGNLLAQSHRPEIEQVAGPGKINGGFRLDLRGLVGQHQNTFGDLNRLFNVVGDERNRTVELFSDVDELVLQIEA